MNTIDKSLCNCSAPVGEHHRDWCEWAKRVLSRTWSGLQGAEPTELECPDCGTINCDINH